VKPLLLGVEEEAVKSEGDLAKRSRSPRAKGKSPDRRGEEPKAPSKRRGAKHTGSPLTLSTENCSQSAPASVTNSSSIESEQAIVVDIPETVAKTLSMENSARRRGARSPTVDVRKSDQSEGVPVRIF
jgi:hypothetical protein